MRIRNMIIVGLILIGAALFGVIQGVIIPRLDHQEQQYWAEQRDPVTHDMESILRYKSKYMGDNSNIMNLFNTLPLNHVRRTYQLYPDQLTAEINYQSNVQEIGEDMIEKSVVYNATAAFALIDNLKAIRFNFIEISYSVSRDDLEGYYGVQLSTLLNKDTWKKTVQERLEDNIVVDAIKKSETKSTRTTP